MKLSIFNQIDFLAALKALFKELNVPVNYISDEPTSAQEIFQDRYKDNDTFNLIEEVYFCGMVDDAAFEGNHSLPIQKIKSDYDGILIFGVTLKDRVNNLLPTRSQLAEISRAFNREYYYTPVLLVFKYGNYLAFANTERIKYKQESREGEKAGKVTLLRDVNIRTPHSGHEKIITELKLPTSEKNKITSFDGVYKYWQSVFSVDILNKKFYQELSTWYFWATKYVTFPGEPTPAQAHLKNAKFEDLLQQHKATNVIRMLTRLLFVWFIKEKGLIPEELFELETLQKDILKDVSPYHEAGMFRHHNIDSVYYKAILQNLFFATLNCPISADGLDKRARGFRKNNFYGQDRGNDWMLRYENYFKDASSFLTLLNSTIPFLNGGLFECLDDKENNNYIDGFSDQMVKGEQLIVPDYLFFGVDEEADISDIVGIADKRYKNAHVKGLINILKSYKFTITENTPIEEDVALDPELLGKVFENLLASYNPETKTTARKQTGSFYTPRTIVNYMVDESLVAYLKVKIQQEQSIYKELGTDQTNLFGNSGRRGQQTLQNDLVGSELKENKTLLDSFLRELISFNTINPFLDFPNTAKIIVDHISKCTILDPACGSGAFPMGVLQKMVHVLQKLDPENKVWKNIQEAKARKEAEEAFDIEDKVAREERLIEINEAFDQSINDADYARKLFLIENCIYGVDIQPIATQISKLRFFISLIVEQKVNPAKANFGIRPLPNLETKFVAANTLIGIEKPTAQLSLYDTKDVRALEKELKKVRSKLFSARSKDTKLKYRQRDEELRNDIAKELEKTGWQSDTAQKLAEWNPYDQNASSPFFDCEWMFEIRDGFDVVIGNPPYGVSIKGNYRLEVLKHLRKVPDFEIYYFFIEAAYKFVRKAGTVTYIIPNTYLFNVFAESYRKELITKWGVNFIIDFTNYSLFETATVRNSVLVLSKATDTKLISYLPTNDVKLTLDEFIRQKVNILNIEVIREFSQNWALAFKLPQSKINAIARIKKNSKPLEYYFPEVSQGLIAYDKYQGQSQDIINSRAYHYTIYRSGLKKWLWGEDVTRYQVKWNGKEYLDYCKGIANPRRPKFFTEKRMLVREITNPTIFAAITTEELYNDPAIIVILDSSFSLEAAAMILNSQIGTFFHFNSSPKATKGDFPKILVKDIRDFPLPDCFRQLDKKFWSCLYSIVSFATISKCHLPTFNSLVDAICFELYFPNHMKEQEINVLDLIRIDIEKEINNRWFDDFDDLEKLKVIEKLDSIWTHPDNEVRNRIKLLAVKSPTIIKPILEN